MCAHHAAVVTPTVLLYLVICPVPFQGEFRAPSFAPLLFLPSPFPLSPLSRSAPTLPASSRFAAVHPPSVGLLTVFPSSEKEGWEGVAEGRPGGDRKRREGWRGGACQLARRGSGHRTRIKDPGLVLFTVCRALFFVCIFHLFHLLISRLVPFSSFIFTTALSLDVDKCLVGCPVCPSLLPKMT